MSGWAVGSNALYHAKLDWIKVWTRKGTHCSNEGHLFHIWQRKIDFIKSHRKQNEVMLFFFYSLSRKQASLVIEEDPAAEVKQRGGNRAITRKLFCLQTWC